MCDRGFISQDFKNIFIAHVFKRKGNRQAFWSPDIAYRGTTFTGEPLRIYVARWLHDKWNRLLLYFRGSDQCLWHTVCCDGLWKIKAWFGCPPKFITMTRQFYDGILTHVLDDGNLTSSFPVTNGVKQGCVLAPTLFSMMFTTMLSNAFKDGEFDINLMDRTAGRFYNLSRHQC